MKKKDIAENLKNTSNGFYESEFGAHLVVLRVEFITNDTSGGGVSSRFANVLAVVTGYPRVRIDQGGFSKAVYEGFYASILGAFVLPTNSNYLNASSTVVFHETKVELENVYYNIINSDTLVGSGSGQYLAKVTMLLPRYYDFSEDLS